MHSEILRILTFAVNLAAVLLISQRFERLSATKAAEADTMVRYSGNDLKKQVNYPLHGQIARVTRKLPFTR